MAYDNCLMLLQLLITKENNSKLKMLVKQDK